MGEFSVQSVCLHGGSGTREPFFHEPSKTLQLTLPSRKRRRNGAHYPLAHLKES